MKIEGINTPKQITEKAKMLFQEEHNEKRLDGWFIIKEIQKNCEEKLLDLPLEMKRAKILLEIAKNLPIYISPHAVFAGTQSDAFAKSYALINPAFTVESFTGYCDPVAVFNDIEPGGDITQERIDEIRTFDKQSQYIKALEEAYCCCQDYTGEAVFFVEAGDRSRDTRYEKNHCLWNRENERRNSAETGR